MVTVYWCHAVAESVRPYNGNTDFSNRAYCWRSYWCRRCSFWWSHRSSAAYWQPAMLVQLSFVLREHKWDSAIGTGFDTNELAVKSVMWIAKFVVMIHWRRHRTRRRGHGRCQFAAYGIRAECLGTNEISQEVQTIAMHTLTYFV